jgi:hypothetical protein
MTIGSYTYDGQVAVITRSDTGQVKKLFVYGGTTLVHTATGTTLVEGLTRDAALEALFSSRALTVQTRTSTTITLHAPGVQQLVANGVWRPFLRLGDQITFSPLTTSLSWAATDGIIGKPFAAVDGNVYQTVQTDEPAAGGKAQYRFYVANPGKYVISALVDAPNEGSNSLFINIDGEPDLEMVWDIEVTKGFEERTAAWRSDGPQTVFELSQGEHELIIRGRESNTRIQRISLVEVLGNMLYLPLVLRPWSRVNSSRGTDQ